MGRFTKVVADFSAFSLDSSEGRIGEYWYFGDSQAYFDDIDHYKIIKAMCMLSCNICDSNTVGKSCCAVSRRNMFKSITQLKGHMFHQHKLFLCSLCLQGRKVRFSVSSMIQLYTIDHPLYDALYSSWQLSPNSLFPHSFILLSANANYL